MFVVTSRRLRLSGCSAVTVHAPVVRVEKVAVDAIKLSTPRESAVSTRV